MESLITALSAGTVLATLVRSVATFLGARRKRTVKVQRNGLTIEVNLEKPDQAEAFLKEFLSQHPGEGRGREND
ncbi:effector-associated constant component EACC1 [Streptomyces sp. Isolate_219]|uniref:effector-associated constant component EACC1 n=1 Tax=Streptomyces sp. Isolate_219 TaxID=2950110 RepID=UPI0021C5B314|nr:hypothetical protein [Streptomyces sp. Isolate_219]MCR8578190.1 hypothetical protein [Streptomyces sp. Isolate_219]